MVIFSKDKHSSLLRKNTDYGVKTLATLALQNLDTCCNTQHNVILSIAILLCGMFLNGAIMLSVVILGAIMLSVVKLGAIMLSVVAPVPVLKLEASTHKFRLSLKTLTPAVRDMYFVAYLGIASMAG
jgi:hypothetical protein